MWKVKFIVQYLMILRLLEFIDQLAGWRNWIAHLTTDQEVPGSSPGSVDTFVFYNVILSFFLHLVIFLIATCVHCIQCELLAAYCVVYYDRSNYS